MVILPLLHVGTPVGLQSADHTCTLLQKRLAFAILTENWSEDGVRKYDELKQCSCGAPCRTATQAYRQESLCLHTSIDVMYNAL